MKKRVGLWRNTSAAGNEYLSSSVEGGERFYVFKNDDGSRRLVKKDAENPDSKFVPVTELGEKMDSKGNPFLAGEGVAIFENSYKEEGSNAPDYNLLID